MDKKMCKEQFGFWGFDVENLFCYGDFLLKTCLIFPLQNYQITPEIP